VTIDIVVVETGGDIVEFDNGPQGNAGLGGFNTQSGPLVVLSLDMYYKNTGGFVPIENGETINHKNYNSLQIKAIVVNDSGEEQVTEKWELLSTTGLLDNQVGELKDSSEKISVPNTNGVYELTFAPSNNTSNTVAINISISR
jgi:uncharacterized protein YkvS